MKRYQIKEAAQLLGTTEKALRSKIRKAELEVSKVNRKIELTEEQISFIKESYTATKKVTAPKKETSQLDKDIDELEAKIKKHEEEKGFSSDELRVLDFAGHDLTENEKDILDYLVINGWYAEEDYSDVLAVDIAEGLNKKIKSVKGVVGSLAKKGYLEIGEAEPDEPYWYAEDGTKHARTFIYPADKFYYQYTIERYDLKAITH